jgi:catechol 2,3-dioxygenase-like lactoylglutathione lyase family enzyme
VKAKRIDHVGVVVNDLDAATQLLHEVFGVVPDRSIEREDLKARFFAIGDGSIELLDVREPEARRARLGDESVKARIEHIAIEVEDLDQTLKLLTALGIETTGPPREGAGALSVWTQAPTSGGIGFQFLQRLPEG